MLAANILIGFQVLGALLGLLLSYAIILWGIPARLRIQERPHALARFHSHLPLIGLNLLIVLGPPWILAVMFPSALDLARPPGWVLLGQCVFVLGFDDLWFYGIHRIMHENKAIYRRIHRIHHEAYAPLPLEYIYTHPLEMLAGTIGMAAPLAVLYLWQGTMSLWTVAICTGLRQIHELDIHSGFRAILFRWIPLLAPAEHHDRHHAKPNLGNYGSATLIWDRVFGTLAD